MVDLGNSYLESLHDFVFSTIPEGFEKVDGVRVTLEQQDSLIGDYGEFVFNGMINDSYGSVTMFESMYQFLHEWFFALCNWGPMFLKDSKSFFFIE